MLTQQFRLQDVFLRAMGDRGLQRDCKNVRKFRREIFQL